MLILSCLHFYLILFLTNDITTGISCYRRQFYIYILVINYKGIQFLLNFQSSFVIILFFRGRPTHFPFRLRFPRLMSLPLKWVLGLLPRIKNALGFLPGGATTLQPPNVIYFLTSSSILLLVVKPFLNI